MKKRIIFCVCTACCLWLTACVGPGTGPYGTYTAADHYRDSVHTAAAVGAVVVGTSILGHALHNDRHYHHRYYRGYGYAPYVYRAPAVYPVPRPVYRPYIYRYR